MKNKITTITFMSFLICVMMLNFLTSPELVSVAERRKLLQFDDLNYNGLLTGKFTERFEEISLDQFIFRDEFRMLKAHVQFDLFRKTDDNDIAIIKDNVFKIDYPKNDKYISNFSRYINQIYDMHLLDNKVYFSIIPDKNYYLSSEENLLKIDYKSLEKQVRDEINDDLTYISIFDELSLKDYFSTDPHWKQANLGPVVNKIKKSMNTGSVFEGNSYTKLSYYPFYGAYYGQSALNLKPDRLVYLENDNINEMFVENIEYRDEMGKKSAIYDVHKLAGIDAYDVFLSGATPLTTLTNESNKTGKKLIIFRDSFASSLAPLLAEDYHEITLIDTRYMSKKLLSEFVDFEDAEILFIYSTSLINHSNILK